MMRSMIFPVLPAPVASGLIMVNVRLVAMVLWIDDVRFRAAKVALPSKYLCLNTQKHAP